MAKNRVIEINGDIGGYSYSMGYVRYLVKELGEGPIIVKVTSYGGDMNHALKIKNIFSEHGDITVEYVGLNASAATLIGHGAKKTLIYEDGLYLIHKPMVWVDTWGFKNEDELTQAIEEMRAQKKDAETMTLTLVQDYVKSRGMDVKTVMDLMKEARWLSAREAVELGLVDELIPTKGKKPVINDQARAIMSAAGLPIPEQEKEPEPESIGTILRDELKKFFSNNKSTMDKQYLFVNKTLNVEGIEVKDGKVSLAVEQILALNNQMKANEDAITNANNATKTAEMAKTTAENTLTDVLNKIDAIDPSIKAAVDADAKITAIRAKLAERPGKQPETPQGGASKNDTPQDKVDWDAIDKLPHNQAVDTEII
jgi:ATP-dependent protease ClpP protease subunit